MSYEAICHTRCFFKNVLWEPGDVYAGEDPPGKHFSKDGKAPGGTPDATTFGDDPRSTTELIVTLRNYGTDVAQKFANGKITRKEIWQMLRSKERTASPLGGGSGGEETEQAPDEKVEVTTPKVAIIRKKRPKKKG